MTEKARRSGGESQGGRFCLDRGREMVRTVNGRYDGEYHFQVLIVHDHAYHVNPKWDRHDRLG